MTELSSACLREVGLSDARELVAWAYHSEAAPAAQVASLAPMVLHRAEYGDEVAKDIRRCAAKHLADLAKTMRRRLDYAGAAIAFAGGLLDHDNSLSREVARRIGLSERPVARHKPVLGAALLARMEWSAAKK